MKVIALIRTSTTVQEVESQKKEVIEAIKRDGIDESDIVIVGGAGASAIKVDEAYQRNMNQVYSLIEGGGISAVYAWAVDRIGRNEEILMKFKNYLIAHRVQLVLLNPTLRLLNIDGTVNNGIELAFSLFAVMAKQEMEQKAERFRRAKERNTEKGLYNGGTVHFGYMADEDGHIIVNEEEADIIKMLFNLYVGGEYSTTQLAKEMQERGIRQRGKAITTRFVNKMLSSTAFIGFTVYNGTKRTYEPIISENMWHKVQSIMSANRKGEANKSSRNLHIANKLIVCTECGRHFFANTRSYQCIGHTTDAKVNGKWCNNNESISTDWVDIAAWSVAKKCEIDYIANFTADNAEKAKAQIEVNNQKIKVLKGKNAKKDERKKRITLAFIEGDIDRKEQQRQIQRMKDDVQSNQMEINKLNEENAKLEVLTNNADEMQLIHLGQLPIIGIKADIDNAFKIAHRHISAITIEPTEFNGKPQRLISIKTVLGEVVTFIYVAKSKVKQGGHPIKLYRQDEEGEWQPFFATVDFVPPFKA